MTDVLTEAGPAPQSDQPPVHTRVVIIGTGFSGLGMAIALQKQGVDFVILEKAVGVGGTWWRGSLPTCGRGRSPAKWAAAAGWPPGGARCSSNGPTDADLPEPKAAGTVGSC